MTGLGGHLDPAAVARFDSLELVARTLVEGFLKGLHYSAAKGSSTEFAEHRPYSPGDDIRRIDWRAFARTDRHYVKQYDDETNVRALLLLDASASMGFASAGVTKLRYATCLAAALGYLLHLQRDAVGLAVVGGVGGGPGSREIPPKATAQHLRGVFGALEAAVAGGTGDLAASIHRAAELLHARSLVIVISDFLEDPAPVLQSVAHLRHRGAEVILFHIVDPAEEDFPFTHWTIFEDPERPGTRLRVDARQVRATYRENLEEHLSILRKGAIALEADYALFNTSHAFEAALAAFLAARSERSP
jgi:uncharacterized protein (DUF58 family)